MGNYFPEAERLNTLLDAISGMAPHVSTLYDEGGDEALYDLLSNSYDDYFPEEEEDLMQPIRRCNTRYRA
jgi:hypothetical protein